MLNKLLEQIRQYTLIRPGDRVICAVSGGADSVAMLFGLYLLKDKLEITLEAAHFDHGLRGEASHKDACFVRELCQGLGVVLHMGSGDVRPGPKGLEAAARDARYAFFDSLEGKIATAHTADDNAETVLMHLVRGTGLRGLGGISPQRGKFIRPMLTATRSDVEAFLAEYHLSWVEDATNETDDFLRNRLRHHVMPLLKQENPQFAHQTSLMAMQLRQDEALLQTRVRQLPPVSELRQMDEALRGRFLLQFLKASGVSEPERNHVLLAQRLVFSQNPSARASFPGGVQLRRRYDVLELSRQLPSWEGCTICPGQRIWHEPLRLWISCHPGVKTVSAQEGFTVYPRGPMVLRPRKPGDTIRLSSGTRSLKKLFIDRKIPSSIRPYIPVVCDAQGILGVYGIGANLDSAGAEQPGVTIIFEQENRSSDS